MSRLGLFGIAIAALIVAAASYLYSRRAPSAADQWAMLDSYCVDCHNDAERAGDLTFERLDPERLHADAAIWENVIRKLRGELMPPPGERRPDAQRLQAFVGFLEESLDAAARMAPNPGAPVLRRLNRAEYANAVRDLIALPVDASALLPGDDSVAGFDNIGSALSISPTLLQAYVDAAATLSRLAIGDPAASSTVSNYRAPRDWRNGDQIDGLPLGTRGGFQVEHIFPLDAEYEIQVLGRSEDDVEITIDRERVALLPNTGPRSARSATVAIRAGAHTLGAALVPRYDPRGVDDLYDVHAEASGIASIAIVGPSHATGTGDTASRRQIFSCFPTSLAEEAACAAEILKGLATRAYRRPMAADDAALATLIGFYAAGRAEGTFDTGIQRALARLLVDPEFIFRFEVEPADLPAGAIYRVSDVELASRLSFFLWSSIPDDELLAVAADGVLHEPAVLKREVRRMLADPKAEALVTNFATQWLQLRLLDTVAPTFMEFDGNLREAMRKETELLFASVLREDRSVIDLLDADYTFVDERLARHYGLPNIRGSRFRRVELPPLSPRRGLLGHGSILTVTSAPNRTSPVKRGQWVLHLLGTPVPEPPPNVETNLEETAPAGAATTMRERLEQHMANPSCAMCHSLIDPLGFALENFDAIGKWRDTEGGHPVDARGEFINGSSLEGVAGLRDFLLGRRELFVGALTESLLTYALGRTLEPHDLPTVRGIVRAAAKDDYRLSALIQGIVESEPMQFRVKRPGEESQQARNNQASGG